MQRIQDGQCGLCTHFGAGNDEPKVVQIRILGEAPADLVEPCGLPENADKGLKVTPIGSCAGFTPAQSA